MSNIALNNEKFAHLLSLHGVLSKQSFQEIDDLCKNNLLASFNNNHKLFAEILFYGMHHLLYKIDINIINNIKTNLFHINKNNKRIKKQIKHSSEPQEDDEYIPSKLTDIPSDVMSSVICPYLDLKSLLSFEKVSKLLFRRSRSARIPRFDLNLSKFYSFTNISYDLLRFKNTSKLSIIVNENHDYNHPYNKNTDERSWYSHYKNFKPDKSIINAEYINLIKHFKYFYQKHDEPAFMSRHKGKESKNVSLKVPIKSEKSMIMSQLKQFYNLSELIIKRKTTTKPHRSRTLDDATNWHYHMDIINDIINKLPSFASLHKIKTLQINNVVSKCTNLMLSKFNYFDIYRPVMIEKLHLVQVNMDIDALNIINNCMVNLNTMYLDEVAMEVDMEHINADGLHINIDDLLMRLTTLCMNVVDTAQPTLHTLRQHLLTQLFMIGDISKCGPLQFNSDEVWGLFNNDNVSSIPNEMIKDRKYLKTLHIHCLKRIHLETINHSVISFTDLIELGIDCKDAVSPNIICSIIEKCRNLQCLSLIIYESFMFPSEIPLQRREMNVNDINGFNKFCDSFMMNNTSIKHLRIKQNFDESRVVRPSRRRIEHISSILIVCLINYINIKKVNKWRKLDSFQFLSQKKLGSLFGRPLENDAVSNNISQKQLILSNNKRIIQTFDDLEEFYLLNCIKNMMVDGGECGISFTGIDTLLFGDNLNKLWTFCNENNKKYKIKIGNSNNMSYNEDEKLIDIHIGKWNHKIHKNERKLFDHWSIDCHYIHKQQRL